MLILTNCLTEVVDEGCLKLASTIAKKIKEKDVNSLVVTYDRESPISDVHLKINKLMLSGKLFSILRKNKENVLYIPFSARHNFSALRIFILTLMKRKGVKAVMTLNRPYNVFGKALLKLSSAQLVTFSKEAYEYHAGIVGEKRVIYLKTGVDTKKFVPVDAQKSAKLKEKYSLDKNKPVVLHVGHIKQGRNVSQLMKLNPEYQAVLVSSTTTKADEDTHLREALVKSNVKIIDSYIENIEEIYQMADVYFFPVNETANCIDVPLSCMEAASCNKPIITTDYAEMKQFKGARSFYFLSDFDEKTINSLVEKALSSDAQSRKSVIAYDWNNAVDYFISNM